MLLDETFDASAEAISAQWQFASMGGAPPPTPVVESGALVLEAAASPALAIVPVALAGHPAYEVEVALRGTAGWGSGVGVVLAGERTYIVIVSTGGEAGLLSCTLANCMVEANAGIVFDPTTVGENATLTIVRQATDPDLDQSGSELTVSVDGEEVVRFWVRGQAWSGAGVFVGAGSLARVDRLTARATTARIVQSSAPAGFFGVREWMRLGDDGHQLLTIGDFMGGMGWANARPLVRQDAEGWSVGPPTLSDVTFFQFSDPHSSERRTGVCFPSLDFQAGPRCLQYEWTTEVEERDARICVEAASSGTYTHNLFFRRSEPCAGYRSNGTGERLVENGEVWVRTEAIQE